MKLLPRHKNFYLMLFADVCFSVLSLYAAYALRFEMAIPPQHRNAMLQALPFVLFTKLSILALFSAYHGMWRYTNLADVINIARAILLSTAVIMTALLLVSGFEGYPRSVFLIDGLLSFLFIGGLRTSIRVTLSENLRQSLFPDLLNLFCPDRKKIVLIRLGSCLIDIFLVTLAFYASYLLRFEFQIPAAQFMTFLNTLPLVVSMKIAIFVFFRIYQGLWRYTGVEDLLKIGKASIVSSLGVVLVILLLYRFQGYPRSVFMLDWGITLLLVAGARVGTRLYCSQREKKFRNTSFSHRSASTRTRLLIIGAGNTGEKVVREILENPSLRFDPIGFLDDNTEKLEMSIHGVKVLDRLEQIKNFHSLFDQILIAIPSATAAQVRRIVALCEASGKPFRIVPSLGELINGTLSVKASREVTIQDLLGREEVRLDKEAIFATLQGKRILVTGAGGSIGSELVRQITRFSPEAIALVDMNEFHLFRIQMECTQRFPSLNTIGFLRDIRDPETLRQVFSSFHPQIIFHAAAYKHVPMQECQPWEAVKNNVVGTSNLLQLAQEYAVKKFVLVSTDKAVRPTNVMGATKRIAEQLVIGANNHADSRFIVVRFGNVLGSSGSVIPLFQEQIARGGPLTVTHPEITRYFMSIPEAAQLILQAAAMGVGGEIFLLDMGNPVKIVDLAQDLIRLHGYEPGTDIDIRFTGLRPGEKLHEELITQGEGIVETQHEKIMVLRGNGSNMNKLHDQITSLLEVSRTFDSSKIKQKLQDIVPEYRPEFHEYSGQQEWRKSFYSSTPMWELPHYGVRQGNARIGVPMQEQTKEKVEV
ncbi:capsular polysaccharide biosynthesis protein CapD [Candidatus Vecturithrix granuli]|uniref:Capsular polysaccharide biosynthesis protein CapD n=1 Tax=Vecturithrix granuli TaxID=1499967 RepID=A0A081BXT5_VECG1|nr:capsular polysaccharide biosynthesis protein CapD [Candidatus Vecturithrix granuli]